MMSLDKLVRVVIPIYKTTFASYEELSLTQCCKVLERYAITIIVPKRLDTTSLKNNYPQINIEIFDDKYFTSVASYNELMLSSVFYSRFVDSTYILLYQLDAYVFEDKLEHWCHKGYDYIGAPWLTRKDSPNFLTRILKYIRIAKKDLKNKAALTKDITSVNRVGNGGFSLRKVSSFLRVLDEEKEHSHLPEDVYFAAHPALSKPTFEEALLFGFDSYPQIGFQITQRLPFGCHAWQRKKRYKFWRKYINLN